MDSGFIAILVLFALIVLAAGVVLFVLARKLVRLAIRAALFLVVVVVLLAGGLVIWTALTKSSGPQSGTQNTARPAATKRAH